MNQEEVSVGVIELRQELLRAQSDGSPATLTVSVPEAARLLGISNNLAYEAAARGEIPTVRIGRRVLVPRAALHRLLGAEAA